VHGGVEAIQVVIASSWIEFVEDSTDTLLDDAGGNTSAFIHPKNESSARLAKLHD